MFEWTILYRTAARSDLSRMARMIRAIRMPTKRNGAADYLKNIRENLDDCTTSPARLLNVS